MSSWSNIVIGDLGEVITGYTPPIKNTEYFGDEYPFITPTDITMDSRIVRTERYLSQKGYEYRKNRLLPPNTVCVTCIASIGKTCMTTVPSVTNQQINSIVVNQDKYDPYFVYYLLITKTDVLQSVANKATTPIVKKSTFASINVCVPPLRTQRKIVNFLDRKTEQIDELIRLKERRIELLQAQRTALINQAVTKGLDRNVEMKPSGVEWIGEIPKNWDTVRCTHLFEVKHIKNTSGEINLSVYRDYGVIKRDSRDDNYNRVSEDTSNYKLVDPGDFVFNKMKCWQGSLGISEYRGIVSPAYTVCKPKRPFHGKYFHYLLRSWSYIQEFNRLSYGVRIGQWELRFEDFKDIVVPYPSVLEQAQIANFLNDKTQQINELIAAEHRKIELLQEYRQSLISEAVTGKIDVRNEV